MGKYDYKYIWVDILVRKYIQMYQKWANINKNTIIQSFICKYEYKYGYNHTQNKKIDMSIDIKATKFANLCTYMQYAIYGAWSIIMTKIQKC